VGINREEPRERGFALNRFFLDSERRYLLYLTVRDKDTGKSTRDIVYILVVGLDLITPS
jgi:hypothetical protein